MWPGADKGLDVARIDPNYANPGYAVSDINGAASTMFTRWITSRVRDDEELLAEVLPDYPATGKRTLQDNGSWLHTMRRDNVELVRTPIQRITPRGGVTVGGVTHDVDVIVYATGFRHTDVLWPVQVVGRDGIDLNAAWGRRPYAYLGITVPGCANFFSSRSRGSSCAWR
ncbi:Putative monooxygenase (fragment) [Mycobacterium canettii CIPT 140070010]